jgi:hypothetical protein
VHRLGEFAGVEFADPAAQGSESIGDRLGVDRTGQPRDDPSGRIVSMSQLPHQRR